MANVKTLAKELDFRTGGATRYQKFTGGATCYHKLMGGMPPVPPALTEGLVALVFLSALNVMSMSFM